MKSSKLPSLKKWRIAATVVAIAAGSAHAQAPESERIQRGEAIVATLNAGQPQPTLEALRGEFPFLADAIAGYALERVMAFGMRCVARQRRCSKASGAVLGWCPRQAGQRGCGGAGAQPFGKAAVAAPCGVARLGQAASLTGGVRLA